MAFEDFYKSDRLVNSIQTLEGRSKFFETAIHKRPTSPFVRQHYARMLYREELMDQALQQIEAAIRIDPKARTLYHTQGLILSRLSTKAESVEIGRKYLFRSEQAFKSGIRMNEGDEYTQHGLAELYFLWATQKANTSSEQVDYLSKAETQINDALKKVRDRERLWILSARIQEWLGNEPERISRLQLAVDQTPGSIEARHILGRAYRKQNLFEKALTVLEPLIKSHFEEFRAFVEYALSLLGAGKSYKEGISVLNQSTLYGLGDPRFIATLGGYVVYG